MTCDHKLTNHNVNQFQPITAVHSQITTCEVKGYVTTVGELSVLAGFIANLTFTDSVNIDLCGWYSSNITCLFLLVQNFVVGASPKKGPHHEVKSSIKAPTW